MKKKILRYTLLVIAGILALEFGSALRALSERPTRSEPETLPAYAVEIPAAVGNTAFAPSVKKVSVGTAPVSAPILQVAMRPMTVRTKRQSAPLSRGAEVFRKDEQLFDSRQGQQTSGDPLVEAGESVLFTGSGTPPFSPGGIAPSLGGGGSATQGNGNNGGDAPQGGQPGDSGPQSELPPTVPEILPNPPNPPLSTVVIPGQTLPDDLSGLPGAGNSSSAVTDQTSDGSLDDGPPRAVPEGGTTALLFGVGFGSLVWLRLRNRRRG